MGRTINGKYYTEKQLSAIKRKLTSDKFDEFLIGGLIGYATGSSLLGGMLGGSFTGGLLGDLLEGDDDSFF